MPIIALKPKIAPILDRRVLKTVKVKTTQVFVQKWKPNEGKASFKERQFDIPTVTKL
jgi:hypothetical protein